MKKNKGMRMAALCLLLMLCLLPVGAGAEITFGGDGTYKWNVDHTVVTITGKDEEWVEIEDSDGQPMEIDIVVQSGQCVVSSPLKGNVTVHGGEASIRDYILGDLTVSGGKVDVKDEFGQRDFLLEGGLFVSGGNVTLTGYDDRGGNGATYGAKLTNDESTITGGSVKILGGHSISGGRPALTREGNVTLTVSDQAQLLLVAGSGIVGLEDNSPEPDYQSTNTPALDEKDLDMLVWSSPVQLETGDAYAFDEGNGTYEVQKLSVVKKTEDLKGKPFIRSFKGWVVTYDPNGGTLKEGAKVKEIAKADDPYTVKTDVFVAPAHYQADGVEVIGATENGYTFVPNQDVTVKAKWKEEAKYTIAFDTDGGNAIDPIVDYAGEAVAKPADPTKEGYSFAGWDTAIPETMPEKNLTIKATWTKNQYTIKFEDEDGNKLGEFTGGYGDPITPPADPTKEGYSFAGWDGLPDTMPAGNLTIKATWTENEDNLDDPENPETLYRAGQYGIDRANLGSLPYKTAAELKDALRKVMINEGFIAEGEEFFDVVLEESLDGGVTWDEVPADEFPAAGYRVVFKYPKGTDKDAFIFKVVHMFAATDTRLNITAGGTETPDVQLTDEGIVVTLKGFSPVMLQWQKKPSAAAMPQTGDPSSLLGWTMLLGASGFGAKMLKRKKK